MLVPAIGLVQVGAQAMADRYTYLPSVGLFLLFVWGAADLAAHWRIRPAVLGATAAALLLAFAGLASRQIRYWADSETLFRHALAVTEKNWPVHTDLGNALSKLPGRLTEAIAEYEAALRINPDDAGTHFNLGNALSHTPGRLPEAVAEYEAALRIRPGYADAHNSLGIALAQTPGRLPEAVSEYEAALRIRPDYAEAHNNLGNALATIPGARGRLCRNLRRR